MQAHAVRAAALLEHGPARGGAGGGDRDHPAGADLGPGAPHRGHGRRPRNGQAADRLGRSASYACTLAPLDPDTHAMMGSVALSWNRLDVAEQALLEALRLDPQHVEARHDLGVVRFRGGELRRGRSGLRLDPARRPVADGGPSEPRGRRPAVACSARTSGMWGVWFLVRIFVSAGRRRWVPSVGCGALRRRPAGLVDPAHRRVDDGDLRVVLWRVLRVVVVGVAVVRLRGGGRRGHHGRGARPACCAVAVTGLAGGRAGAARRVPGQLGTPRVEP